MNKAEKMKKLALSMKNFFKKNGSPEDKQVYRTCLSKIKIEATKGKLECTFHIDEYNHDNVDVEMVAAWLKKDGFEVILTPFFAGEIYADIEEIEDWKMKVSWK